MNDTAATKKSDSLVLDTADERKLEKEVSEVELSAQSIVILTDEDFAAAGEYTRMVKATLKKVEEYWEPMRVSTKAAYDAVIDHKREMIVPLQSAEAIVKRKMSDYTIERERKRKEQEEAMRRAAQAEADRKLQEAIDASNSGDTATAEFAMAEAEVYDAAATAGAIQSQAPKAKGVSTKKTWKITAIDSSKVPIVMNGMELRPVDEKLVMQLIKASKGKISIPGVQYTEDVVISVKK